MAKLGWGTPTLITLSLGVIIEIPGQHRDPRRAASSRCPTEDDAAPHPAGQLRRRDRVRQASALCFFAALFESRILFMTHRGRDGPAGRVGRRRRTSCSASAASTRASTRRRCRSRARADRRSTSSTSLGAASASRRYFAVTSNTVQFGAHAELLLRLRRLRHRGRASASTRCSSSRRSTSSSRSRASFSLKVFGVGVFSVRLELKLEGPTPWRAQGTGLDLAAVLRHRRRLRHHLGRASATPSLPPVAVLPLLEPSWPSRRTGRRVPAAGREPARLAARARARATALVLHPVGTLRVSQRAVPLDLTARQGRRPASPPTSTQARPRRRRTAARQAAPTRRSRSRPRSSRTSTTRRSCRTPAYEADRGRHRAAVAGDAAARRARRQARRPLRADHHRHELPPLPPPLPRLPRRAVRALPATAPASPVAAVAAAPARQLRAVRRRVAVGGEASSSRSPPTTPRSGADAAFTSEAEARERPRGAAGGRPALAGALHVVPDVRGRRRMTTPLAHLLVPALAAPGARQRDHAADRRRRRSSCARASVHARSQVTGEPVGGGADRRGAVPRDVAALRARRRRRHRPARDRHAPSRATGSPTSSPTTCRCVEFYDEDFPWRYTPAAPDGDRRGCARGSRWSCWREDEFDGGGRRRGRPLPFIDGRRPRPCCPPPTSCGPGRTCTSTAARPAATPSSSRPTWARCCRGCRPSLDENPDLAYSRLLCPRRLDRERRLPRLPGPGVRDRAAGRRSATTRRRAARDAPRPGRPTRAARAGVEHCPYYYRWYFRTGAAGRLRVPGPAAAGRSRSTRASARATWTCSAPASNLPGIADPDLGGVLRLGGALRCPRATSPDDELAEVERVRALGRARIPHPSSAALAALRQPAPTTTPAQPPTTPTPRPASGRASSDDPDPLDHRRRSTAAGTR